MQRAPTVSINVGNSEKFRSGFCNSEAGEILGDFSVVEAPQLPAFLVRADDLLDRDLDAEYGSGLDGSETFQFSISLGAG